MARVSPIEAHSSGKIIQLLLKIEYPVATTVYVYMELRIRATIFSNGSIIPTGFKFTESHALTLTAHSYALLLLPMTIQGSIQKYATLCSMRMIPGTFTYKEHQNNKELSQTEGKACSFRLPSHKSVG